MLVVSLQKPKKTCGMYLEAKKMRPLSLPGRTGWMNSREVFPLSRSMPVFVPMPPYKTIQDNIPARPHASNSRSSSLSGVAFFQGLKDLNDSA